MATTDDGIDWEGIAREQLERTATRTADDVERAIRLLGGNIDRGTVDEDDLKDAREAIETAIYVLENDLAPAVPGDHGRGDTRYIRNDGTAVHYLGMTMDQVNEVRGGAKAPMCPEEVQALSNGEDFVVKTEAGIEVHLIPTDGKGGSNV